MLILRLSRETLNAVVLELDKTLFESYVKPKSAVLQSIVRGGVLDGAVDWYDTPLPKGTTQFCASHGEVTADFGYQRFGLISLISSFISLAYTHRLVQPRLHCWRGP